MRNELLQVLIAGAIAEVRTIGIAGTVYEAIIWKHGGIFGSFAEIKGERMMIMSDTTDIIGVIFSGLGVLVTGYFSYQISQANKKSAEAAEGATKAAVESAKISKVMLDIQQSQKEAMKKQVVRGLLNRLRQIMWSSSVIITSELSNHRRAMEHMPESIDVSKEEVASYFDDREQSLLTELMALYEDYRKDYFENGTPKFTVSERYIEFHKHLNQLSSTLIDMIQVYVE